MLDQRQRSGLARCVREYEAKFAAQVQISHAFSFWKGRVALSAILESLGIAAGDEVILPGYTCVVVPNAVRYCGATPVYADVDRHTFNLDAGAVQRRITPHTRAIIVQHTYGIAADLDPILDVAAQAQVPVIEDCAHALGSLYRRRPVGTQSAAAFFSFQWSKPYSTGLGGMATTSDASLAQRLAEVQARYTKPRDTEITALRIQGLLYRHILTPRLFWLGMDTLHRLSSLGLFVGSSSSEEVACTKPDRYEKRMSMFQAAWGLREIDSLQRNLAHRRHIVRVYESLLREANFRTIDIPSYTDPVFVRYPLLVRDKEAILRQARQAHVEIGSWFECTVHPRETPLAAAGYRTGDCPVGEELSRHVINLPTHRKVSTKEATHVVEFLADMRARGWA